ncbi:PH domain-containing protein [Streptomyces sp. NPDC047014]|uniref:PH domain-containing protein n=1 Tax=Streptomyces sp. NPDC047014 TaxID=3155736 RepID=UPI00341042C0
MKRAGMLAIWLATALLGLMVAVVAGPKAGEAWEREQEFRASPVCASVPLTASRCLWEQAYTVRESMPHGGERQKEPAATLLLPDGAPRNVTFFDSDPVLSRMRPGDAVVGLVWHGDVVEVRDAEGRRQETMYGPVDMAETELGAALTGGSFGLLALVGSVWAIVGGRERRHERASAWVRWHGLALGGGALLATWAQLANGWPLWSIWVLWGPLAVVLLTTMTMTAVRALRESGADTAAASALTTEPPVLPSASPDRPAGSDSGGLPREYRMGRNRRNGMMIALVVEAVLMLFTVWTEDLPPFWFQLGLTVVTVPLVVLLLLRAPRVATQVDASGIRTRGVLRTRRMPWADVEEFTVDGSWGSEGGAMARRFVYVQPRDGRRRLLRYLEDKDYDLDGEIAILRAALAEARGTDRVHAPAAADPVA